jgi:hypothetical protein
MRTLRLIATLALLTGIAFAGDVTGKWTAQINGPDGNAITVNYDFKQEAEKLTGTVEGPGGAIPITDGKVDGDKIAFNITFNDMKVGTEGTVKGEEILVTVKVNGEAFGGPVTLKRVK